MKRIVCVVLLVVLSVAAVGCGEGAKSEKNYIDTNVDTNMIDLFVPGEYEVIKSENKYQIKQPDSVNAAVEEVLDALKKEYDGIIVHHKYMMDKNNILSIEVMLDRMYEKKDSRIIVAAITNTLFEINGINGINVNLLDPDEMEIFSLEVKRDTFYLYGYSKDFGYNYNFTVFYLPNESGDGLVKSTVKLYSNANVSSYERIIKYLVEVKVLPAKTKVNSIYINNNICYIDFNAGVEDASEVKSSLAIYSMVNTLTTLPNIDKVVITENGSLLEKYKKTVDVSKPLGFNEELVR